MTRPLTLANSPDPTTVYAVSSGDYSTYSVIAVFERLEDALAYAAERNEVTVEDMTHYDQVGVMPVSNERSALKARKRYTEVRRKLESYDAVYVERFDFYPAPPTVHS